MNYTDLAVEAYLKIVEAAVPIAIVFSFGNLMIDTLLRTAFGGKFYFGKGKDY